jgi:hypothetical protein
MSAARARQQQAGRIFPPRWRRQSAQSQKPSYDHSSILIGRDQAFGIQLAEGDMQGPLLVAYNTQTIHGEVDTLPDAQPGGTSEQQRLGAQVIAALEFFLEPQIIFGGKRSRQNEWQRWEVLAANESGLEGIAVVGKVVQQAAQA